MLAPGLGCVGHHRVAPAGARIKHASVPTGHRPRLERHSRSGGANRRTDVPKFVDWYMNGKIENRLE